MAPSTWLWKNCGSMWYRSALPPSPTSRWRLCNGFAPKQEHYFKSQWTNPEMGGFIWFRLQKNNVFSSAIRQCQKDEVAQFFLRQNLSSVFGLCFSRIQLPLLILCLDHRLGSHHCAQRQNSFDSHDKILKSSSAPISSPVGRKPRSILRDKNS